MDLFESSLIKSPEILPHDIPYISAPDEISNDDYHRSPMYKRFISSTGLKNYLISPKYAKYIQDNPKPSTPAMEFGSLYHDLLKSIANTGSVEAAIAETRIFAPPINSKTGEPYGKNTKAYQEALQEQGEGLTLVSQEDYDISMKMINELLSGDDLVSNEIRWLLKNGQAEQSHFIDYLGYGFKYRTDLKTKAKIVDWKTTTLGNPKVEEFSQVIIKYGYHISAAMYQFFEHKITGVWKPFFWVAQEKEPPYSFTILDSSEWTWEFKKDGDDLIVIPKTGALLFIKLMEQYIYCNENNTWPGYSIFIKPDYKHHRIGVPQVPGWYKGLVGDITYYNKK